ncbi:hypothetical protein [Yinghuangia soli]|uniref:Uncharacterized protein n=1 Tax=Yinghuangia soli TaxID=2908204 RepID=A0AA41Q9G1_9ACTN|nr:hypothetical protein [Yinghuangia soli]MCF2532647.1 hypothetical protein [Yinghuangia soli]
MPKTRRLVAAAICAAGITVGSVLTATPAMAATGTYDCEINGSGAPTPDYDNVSVDFTNNGTGKLVITGSGLPSPVDLPIGALTVTSSSPSISASNTVFIPQGDDVEVVTSSNQSVPNPLPGTLTITVPATGGGTATITCTKQ